MNSSAHAASSAEVDAPIEGSSQTLPSHSTHSEGASDSAETSLGASDSGQRELTSAAIGEIYGALLENQAERSTKAGVEGANSNDAPDSAAAMTDASAAVATLGAGNSLTDDEILNAVTALVFASPEPIALRRLVALLENPAVARVEAALVRVRERLMQSNLPLELREIAGGFQILTTPEMGETIQRLFKARKAERISPAALETLAVVAYRQPVTKAEIEAIRGVQGGPILRTLIDRGLVRVAGHADVPGHPLLYATTREFLDRFGLASLGELPRDAELTKD